MDSFITEIQDIKRRLENLEKRQISSLSIDGDITANNINADNINVDKTILNELADSPDSPAAGTGFFYYKADKKLYYKDSDGNETQIGEQQDITMPILDNNAALQGKDTSSNTRDIVKISDGNIIILGNADLTGYSQAYFNAVLKNLACSQDANVLIQVGAISKYTGGATAENASAVTFSQAFKTNTTPFVILSNTTYNDQSDYNWIVWTALSISRTGFTPHWRNTRNQTVAGTYRANWIAVGQI